MIGLMEANTEDGRACVRALRGMRQESGAFVAKRGLCHIGSSNLHSSFAARHHSVALLFGRSVLRCRDAELPRIVES